MREHSWQPGVIDGLFLDKEDHHGLFYWYNDSIDVMPEGKEKERALKNKY